MTASPRGIGRDSSVSVFHNMACSLWVPFLPTTKVRVNPADGNE